MAETVESASPDGIEDARVAWSSLSTGDWFRLFGRQFGIMGDALLAVLGSALVALGVSVLLDAFDVISVGFEGSTGTMLGGGLVLVVVGLFALGIASDGPITGPVVDWPDPELVIARVAATVVVCTLAFFVVRFVHDAVAGIGAPFEVAMTAAQATVRAGFLVALPVGVGGSWAARRWLELAPGWDRPIILGAWTMGAWAFLLAALP